MAAAVPPDGPVRARAAYENWRPALTGVMLLVPVGGDGLLFTDTAGRGALSLPTGAVEAEEAPEVAAQRALKGAHGPIPVQRQVAVNRTQMRRRKVITHLVSMAPITPAEAQEVTYRDPRAVLHVLPTERAARSLPPRARALLLLGLQALAAGVKAYIEDDIIQRLEAVTPTAREGGPPVLPRLP